MIKHKLTELLRLSAQKVNEHENIITDLVAENKKQQDYITRLIVKQKVMCETLDKHERALARMANKNVSGDKTMDTELPTPEIKVINKDKVLITCNYCNSGKLTLMLNKADNSYYCFACGTKGSYLDADKDKLLEHKVIDG